jgi:hypothetical protein
MVFGKYVTSEDASEPQPALNVKHEQLLSHLQLLYNDTVSGATSICQEYGTWWNTDSSCFENSHSGRS